MTYPRAHNGYVDSGKPLAQSLGKRCPNCGSSSYRETVSLESCTSCGLRCDYWGGGANSAYQDYVDAKHERHRLEDEERDRLEEEANRPRREEHPSDYW